MFIALKDEKIIAHNDNGEFPCLVYDEIKEIENCELVEIGGEFVVATDERAIEQKKNNVRLVRNYYLEQYVDPKQLVLVWETLTEEQQLEYKNYRQYLLDYTNQEDWYLQNPLTFDEWNKDE